LNEGSNAFGGKVLEGVWHCSEVRMCLSLHGRGNGRVFLEACEPLAQLVLGLRVKEVQVGVGYGVGAWVALNVACQ
jgi:hypothetical protein